MVFRGVLFAVLGAILISLFQIGCGEEDDDTDAGADGSTDTDVDTDADTDTDSDSDLTPTLSITATPMSGRADLDVAFSADGAGGDGTLTYAWTFGDSATSAEQNPDHTYVDMGEHTASCTVTDEDGDTDGDSLEINVGAHPVRTVTVVEEEGFVGPCGNPLVTRTTVIDEMDAGVDDTVVELEVYVDGGVLIGEVLEGTALSALPASSAIVETSSTTGELLLSMEPIEPMDAGLTDGGTGDAGMPSSAMATVSVEISSVAGSGSSAADEFGVTLVGDCCDEPIVMPEFEGTFTDTVYASAPEICDFNNFNEGYSCDYDTRPDTVFTFTTDAEFPLYIFDAYVDGDGADVFYEIRDVTSGCPGTPVTVDTDTCFEFNWLEVSLPAGRNYVVIIHTEKEPGGECGEVSLWVTASQPF